MAINGLMYRDEIEQDRDLTCARVLTLEKLIMDAKERRNSWDVTIKEYEIELGKCQEELSDLDMKYRRRYGREYL